MTGTDEKVAGGAAPESSPGITRLGRFWATLLGPPSRTTCQSDGRLRFNACHACANSVGIVNVVANTFLMIMKAYLGVVGRSTALVADAIHSSADVVSSVMLLIGLRIAKKPVNERYPYGYGQVEFLVAIVIYSSLIMAGIVIFIDAISCLIHKNHPEPSTVALLGAFISVLVNEMMFRQSVCAGGQLSSPSMVANAWEKRGDALSSLAVFVGIGGAKLGFKCLDPMAAILVAVWILKSSAKGIVEAFRGLTDAAIEPDQIKEIRKNVAAVSGVVAVDALRSRHVGQVVWVDLEVTIDGEMEMGESAVLKERVRQAVERVVSHQAKIAVYLKPSA